MSRYRNPIRVGAKPTSTRYCLAIWVGVEFIPAFTERAIVSTILLELPNLSRDIVRFVQNAKNTPLRPCGAEAPVAGNTRRFAQITGMPARMF